MRRPRLARQPSATTATHVTLHLHRLVTSRTDVQGVAALTFDVDENLLRWRVRTGDGLFELKSRISDITALDLAVVGLNASSRSEEMAARLIVELESSASAARPGDAVWHAPSSAHIRATIGRAQLVACYFSLLEFSALYELLRHVEDHRRAQMDIGVPSWAKYVPRRAYTPRTRRTLQRVLLVWSVVSVFWALWQLYRHQQFLAHWIDLCADKVRELLHKHAAVVGRLLSDAVDRLGRAMVVFHELVQPLQVLALNSLRPALVLASQVAAPARRLWSSVSALAVPLGRLLGQLGGALGAMGRALEPLGRAFEPVRVAAAAAWSAVAPSFQPLRRAGTAAWASLAPLRRRVPMPDMGDLRWTALTNVFKSNSKTAVLGISKLAHDSPFRHHHHEATPALEPVALFSSPADNFVESPRQGRPVWVPAAEEEEVEEAEAAAVEPKPVEGLRRRRGRGRPPEVGGMVHTSPRKTMLRLVGLG